VKLEDGTGKGFLAKVDDENRVLTFSVVEPEDKHINIFDGGVWSYNQSTTAAGVGDYVYYLKNTGSSTITVTDLRVFVSAATVVYFDKVTGTAVGGTDLTPVSRNLGSSKTPEATSQEGTDITGLASGGVLYFQACDTANKHYHLKMSANIVIPQGQAVALRTSAAVTVDSLISVMEI
jgi:hypothetical protein